VLDVVAEPVVTGGDVLEAESWVGLDAGGGAGGAGGLVATDGGVEVLPGDSEPKSSLARLP